LYVLNVKEYLMTSHITVLLATEKVFGASAVQAIEQTLEQTLAEQSLSEVV
jgi:hypothetical protein